MHSLEIPESPKAHLEVCIFIFLLITLKLALLAIVIFTFILVTVILAPLAIVLNSRKQHPPATCPIANSAILEMGIGV
jgi:hypothetical protein